MRQLYRKAYRKFYFHPVRATRLLLQVRSLAQFKTITNGLLRLAARPVAALDPRKRKPASQRTAP